MMITIPNYPIIPPYRADKEISYSQPTNNFWRDDKNCLNFLEAFKEYREELERKKVQAAKINVLQVIMQNNKNCPKDLDTEELSRMILDISEETDVDPVIIACIAQQETNFNQAADSGTGKGMMQVVPITVKDMFVRPEIYSSKMKQLIKKYKTLENVFTQKDINPEMDLGDFGEMLYKYGNNENLFNVVKTDTYTALKVGAYAYIAKLHLAKSLTKNPANYEKLALELYNSYDSKKSYSNKVYNQIVKYRQMMKTIDITV